MVGIVTERFTADAFQTCEWDLHEVSDVEIVQISVSKWIIDSY